MVIHKYISILNVAVSLVIFLQVNAFAENNTSQISASYFGYHSGIIKNDGSLLMWGSNANGQFGINNIGENNNEYADDPKLVLKDAKFISFAGNTTALIKKDDTLWMSGGNEYGQLGNGTKTDKSKFVKIMSNVDTVSLSAYHVFAVKKDGTLWAWGNNDYGKFCNGTTNHSLTPVKIMDGVQTAYAGLYHSAIKKIDGTFWMCGYNGDGNLGLGYKSDQEEAPIEVYFKDHIGKKLLVKDVSLGYVSTLFLLKDNTLWFAGYDGKGDSCLGDDFIDFSIIAPVKIANNVKLARKSTTFSAYVTTSNELYMCGGNENGQLGLGYQGEYESVARRVMGNVEDIQTGYSHSIALLRDGSLYAWGSNFVGELGLGYSSEVVNRPTKVNIPIAFIDVPIGLTLSYNGNTQFGVARGTGYTISGNSGRNIGKYKAILRLVQGYVWSDGTTENKEVEWKIVNSPSSSYVLQIPKGEILNYNGKTQIGVQKGVGYTVSGNAASKVGKYKAILKLFQNYEWSDGTTENKEVEWQIIRAYVIDIPEGLTLEYNGRTQTGVMRGTGYTITGNTGVKVGNYNATLKLTNDGYGWSDGTTDTKEIKWCIVKGTNPLTVVGKNVKVSLRTLSQRNVILLRSQVFDIKQFSGNLSFKKVRGNSRKITVNQKTGALTLSKGLKRGRYNVKIKVSTQKDENYNAGSQIVMVKIKVTK